MEVLHWLIKKLEFKKSLSAEYIFIGLGNLEKYRK